MKDMILIRLYGLKPHIIKGYSQIKIYIKNRKDKNQSLLCRFQMLPQVLPLMFVEHPGPGTVKNAQFRQK